MLKAQLERNGQVIQPRRLFRMGGVSEIDFYVSRFDCVRDITELVCCAIKVELETAEVIVCHPHGMILFGHQYSGLCNDINGSFQIGHIEKRKCNAFPSVFRC